jgi:hypothetical protein
MGILYEIVRSRKSEVGRPKSEVRSPKSKLRRTESEVRSWKAEDVLLQNSVLCPGLTTILFLTTESTEFLGVFLFVSLALSLFCLSLLSSVFRLPTSVFCLPSSVFRLLSSVFRLLSSVFRLLSSVFCLPSSFFFRLPTLIFNPQFLPLINISPVILNSPSYCLLKRL